MQYRFNPQLLSLTPSASIALMDKARAMKAQGLDIISLAGGEPDFDTPAAASLAGIGAITAGQTHYTTGRGMPKLRARIARKLREENGIPAETADSLYDEINDFANYAFNKAHAVCYAVVSYQTAYLKCHYPKEYMAALMTSVLDSATKISGYIAECKEMGIQTLPPDINASEDVFTVQGSNIRFGLGAVKNIGRD